MTRPIAALLLCGIAAALAVLLRKVTEDPFPAFELDEPDEEGLFAPMAAWENSYTIHWRN